MTPNLLVAGALLLFVAGVYWEVVLGGQTFALRDHLFYTVPLRAALKSALLAGRFPEWWSGVGLGTPFAANPAHQAFSPLAWLGALLPESLGADLEQLAFLWVAGVGAALFAGRLGATPAGSFVAGALLATSGYLGSMAVNGNLPCLAYLPWLAWAAARLADADAGPGARGETWRAALVVAVFGALQLTGAEPGSTISAALLAVAVTAILSRRPLLKLAWLAGAGGVAGLLAAFTLLPALLLAPDTARGGGLDLGVAGAWSLHPLRLLEAVWPHFLGDPVDVTRNAAYLLANTAGKGLTEPSWSYSLFLGAPALALAAAGAQSRRARALLGTSAAFLLLALGTFTPFFELLRTVFPPERFMRYPEKHVVGALVLFTGFAGPGFSQLARGAWGRSWVAALAAVAVLLGLCSLGLPRATGFEADLARSAVRAGLPLNAKAALGCAASHGLFAACATALCAAGAWLARRNPRWGAGLAAAAVLGACALETRSVQVFVPRRLVEQRPELLRAADTAAPAEKRLFRDSFGTPLTRPEQYAAWGTETLAGNVATRWGFQVLPGMDPTASGAFQRFWDGQYGKLPQKLLAELSGVPWALFPEGAVPAGFSPPVARRAGVVLVAPERTRPRAFLATRWTFAESRDESLWMLANSNEARDPGLVVLEGSGVSQALPGADGPVPCAVTQERPEVVRLTCRSVTAGYAVLLDGWAPGWEVFVDGAQGILLRADGLFRAVAVPAGEHQVEFRYGTPGLLAGLAVSGATALALLGLSLLSLIPSCHHKYKCYPLLLGAQRERRRRCQHVLRWRRIPGTSRLP